MKNFTFLAILFLSLMGNVVTAQDAPLTGALNHNHSAKVRCGTTEYYDELFRTNPGFKAQFEANQLRIAQLASQRSGQRTAALNDTVPIVIHVVGSAARQTQITDAILQSQIDVLNEDFQGKNADSSRIPASFKPLYGKMGLTFKLALTSPTGTLTNGIERRTNAITFTQGTFNNAKQFSTGGLDAWDPTKYLNIWVVEFTDGILGISVFPGDPRPLNLHGFVCDYRGFGRSASYLFPEYNKGRTTTHELGHFWNLRHIWGDDGTACTGSDFPATTFPAGTDDTPNQGGPTFGNPDVPGTGTVLTDACSAAAPGIMYQNYMDYSDDIALVMFTKGQANRMEGALTVAPDRNPILNSNAYNPPVLYPNDASISTILNPSASAAACNTTTAPQVTLTNAGTSPLTSVTIILTVNGVAQPGYPYAWTGTLAPGASVNVTLPVITLATGNNTVVVSTSQPNGVADQNTLNDSKSVVVNLASLLNLPVSEGFESTTFPPAPWTVVSVNAVGTANWARNTPGNASAGAMWINNYSNSSGAIDDFRSGNYSVNPTDEVKVSFDVAHRPYNATTADSLLVLISTDCGLTFTQVYKKWSSTTAGPNTLSTNLTTTGFVSYVPAAADWRRETISIPASLLASGRIQVVFRSRSAFGNNIWIDNINIEKVYIRDLKVSTIVSPTGNVCANTVSPQVTITNNGSETINSFQVGYTINGVPGTPTTVNTPLAAGASTTVTLSTTSVAAGAGTFVVTASNIVFASGNTDQEAVNNTLTSNFTVVPLQTVIREGFETTPVPGWSVSNPNGNNTWGIVTPGNNSLRSAFINNYDNNFVGNIDDLRSPY
ncbi:MAG TPA: M43 family zinc metalloprotease, partial [Flavisolibacter sp.]